MKLFIFLLFAFSFLSGCNFLSEGETQLADADNLTLEEENLDDFVIEEEDMEEDLEESEIETDEELEEDMLGDEEDIEDEMEEELGEDIEEDEMDEDETEKSKKSKGFFSWLFGPSDDEEPDEGLDNEFIGEDEDFSSAERDYEDYEENTEDYSATESIQTDIPEENIAQEDTSTTELNKIETEVNTEEPKAPIQKQRASLNKIITIPYKKAGKTINAVYIARPDEDLTSISQKIYGRNEEDQLLQINTHLQNRSVVVGDKIYYNSPNRPNDNNKVLFYYQDNGISPSYYNLSPGDNIRTVASQLLGHPKSWKEIWATNPNLKSKSEVTTSLSIAYWPQSATQIAYNNPPAPDQPSQPQPNEEPLQTPENLDLTPSPEENLIPNEDLSNQQEPQPEPEEDLKPPVSDVSPPIQEETKKPKGIIKELLNNVEMIVGIIVFLILLYLIIHIIIKKRKQRDFDYTATNIEM